MSESKHTPQWFAKGIDVLEVSPEAPPFTTLDAVAPSHIDCIATFDTAEQAMLAVAAPQMLEAHKADAMDAHDALARLPSIEWVGHAETRDLMALIGKLRERLVAIAKRSDAAIAAATGGEQ